MSRCDICDPTCRLITGDGPQPCDTLFIGEKPGQTEDRFGRVFAGDTGQELNNLYLPIAGLDRGEVRVTNSVKCRLGGNNNKPTDKQILACASHWLPAEVDRCQPNVIFLLGATACSLVPRIELDKDHGLPLEVTAEDCPYFGGWSGWVFPSYHPAAALHDTGMMIPLLDDFERFRKWRAGTWRMPRPIWPVKALDYRVLESKDEVHKALLSRGQYKYLPVDTEDDGKVPWSLQFSTEPGNGFMIRANRPDLIRFFDMVTAGDGFLLHYAEHDLDVLEVMGIKKKLYRCTMRMAYQLGNQPQGLKALGWRLLGIRMRDYMDVVMPHSRARMIEWLTTAWDVASDKRDRIETQLKTKVKITYKPTQVERGLKRILSHSHKPEYDLWEKTTELTEKLDVTILNTATPYPSIAHVPLEEAVIYACQDADVTGQVGAVMERQAELLMQGEWQIPEEDWDQ